MTTMQQTSEESDPIRPIQFLIIGEQAQIPAPLIRIRTCGLLTIEIVAEIVQTDPPMARYVSLTPEQLRGRGTAPALMLLKLLLNRYERFASREWLMEQFCRDGELFSTVRLDNIVSMLRGLLCPPAYQDLRKHLVSHVRGSTSSGDGYQLASYPLIWVDQDALMRNVEHAARMERFGDDGLLFWERAYELARRGPYLPDEMFSDWASARRGEVAGMLRQSIQALARLYLEQHGTDGEDEALLLLRSYWQENQRDEDVLRPLMELLGRRECYHEALEYYEQLCDTLKTDERQPDPQTQDVAAYLQTKHIQRSPQRLNLSSLKERQNDVSLFNTSALIDVILKQDLLGEEAKQDLLSPYFSVAPLEDNLMATFDPSRRLLLQGLMGLAASLSPSLNILEHAVWRQEGGKSLTAPAFFAFQNLIEMCWQLCNSGQIPLTEQILASFLPTAIERASFQLEAAKIASHGLRLKSILCAHQLQLAHMIPLCQQSVAYAQAANDPNTLSAALTGLAVAFKYNKQPLRSFEAYEAALLASERATPFLRSRVYAGAASTFVSRGLRQEALRLVGLAYEQFPAHAEDDPMYLSSDNGLFMLAYYEGLLYLALEQPKDAIRAFESYHGQSLPERNRLEILNHQGKAALLCGDLDTYVLCLEEGITGAQAIQSRKRLHEALEIFQEQMPRSWLGEPKIQQLQEKIPLLRGQSPRL